MIYINTPLTVIVSRRDVSHKGLSYILATSPHAKKNLIYAYKVLFLWGHANVHSCAATRSGKYLTLMDGHVHAPEPYLQSLCADASDTNCMESSSV